jgi:hypothetical protein
MRPSAAALAAVVVVAGMAGGCGGPTGAGKGGSRAPEGGPQARQVVVSLNRRCREADAALTRLVRDFGAVGEAGPRAARLAEHAAAVHHGVAGELGDLRPAPSQRAALRRFAEATRRTASALRGIAVKLRAGEGQDGALTQATATAQRERVAAAQELGADGCVRP